MAAVTGTFTATGNGTAFVSGLKAGQGLGRFNVSTWGTFVATVVLERSFDAGSTWLQCSSDGAGTAASYTVPVSLVVEEPEVDVQYRLRCSAYTSGTVNYRISQ